MNNNQKIQISQIAKNVETIKLKSQCGWISFYGAAIQDYYYLFTPKLFTSNVNRGTSDYIILLFISELEQSIIS